MNPSGAMASVKELLQGIDLSRQGGLAVTAPDTGAVVASIPIDTKETLNQKVVAAGLAQKRFAALKRAERVMLVETYAAALKNQREALANVLHTESGKTMAEALGEVDGSANVLTNTIKDTTLADLGNMQRVKERPPVGIVGLITSFNFPMAVAHWTMAPAFIARNAVVWKPSEKTPMSALACKAVFDAALPEFKDLLQVVIGMREVGEALVAHESVDLISATGSVAMGQGIRATLAKKKNNQVAPILELGGNNGVIISENTNEEHLAFAVNAIMGSYLGTTGQRCTNTRRIIAHKSVYDKAVALFSAQIDKFLQQSRKGDVFDPSNSFGYASLIDKDAFERFESAKKQAVAEGGKILFGARVGVSNKDAYMVEPSLALMPAQTGIMHKETFAPLLFIAPYDKFPDALAMLNTPENSGLVGAIYTLSQKEADQFALHCQAGHALINPPKGTGTPAHGMGFGGNKESGSGEILNTLDPLAAFTRPGAFTRIATNKDIPLN